MKLLFVITTIDRGGAELLLLNLLRSLSAKHEIHLYYLKGNATLLPNIRELGIEAQPIKIGSLGSFFHTLHTLRSLLLTKEKICIQGWMYHGNILATLLYLLFPYKNTLYWCVHHSANDLAKGKTKYKLWFNALLSRFANRVVYVTEQIRDEHIKCGFSRRNPLVIHNGVDSTVYRYNHEGRFHIRTELKISSSAIVIAAIGRNHPVKDYSTFFRGVAPLIKTVAELHVIVAGRDLHLDAFKTELSTLNAEELSRIHLLGERDDIPNILSAIDIYALTSRSESFPLALFEAFATARCCVASDVIFNKNMFPEALRTFTPGDAAGFGEALNHYIKLSSSMRDSIGALASKTVQEHYSLKLTVDKYLAMWTASPSAQKQMNDLPLHKTKIIRIISRLNIGGPVIHVTLLNKHFHDDDWHSTLVTGRPAKGEGDMSYLAHNYGVRPIVFRGLGREISLWDDFVVLIQLIRLFIKEKPDIVHTHTAKAGTLGRLAAFLTGVPKVYHTFHGNVFEGYFSPLKTKVFILIERLLALVSTKIIAISELQKKDLLRERITSNSKITVIPLGFDFSRILPIEPEEKLRKELNIPDDKIIVAIIGRITHIKNHALFFEIAQRVLAITDHVHFLVIGDGDMRLDAEQQVKKMGIEKSVSFTGFITNLKHIYGSVDIVVLSSFNEGTPVSLLEAMACNKLVLSTKVGGVQDFITNGVNGFAFGFDPDEFCNVISDYIANPAKYLPLREQAAKDILPKYDKERLFRDIEALYRS